MKALIGVVHLPPLPGAPLWSMSVREIAERAVGDALKYAEAGFTAVLVENYGDKPYYPRRVPPETVASMSVVVARVAEEVSIPVGVSVLRNDSLAALAVAAAAGAEFIRVNVLSEAYATDQGVIEPEAHVLMRMRRSLQADIKVLADIRVKHARPLVERPLEHSARDLAERSLADAIIVTGEATGEPPSLEAARVVKGAVSRPVLAGSGVTASNIQEILSICDGAIVGTAAKQEAKTENPVDPARAKAIAEAASSYKIKWLWS